MVSLYDNQFTHTLWVVNNKTVNGLNPGVSLCGLMVRVRLVPRRTVVGDIDRRFDNLSGSHDSHPDDQTTQTIVNNICVSKFDNGNKRLESCLDY